MGIFVWWEFLLTCFGLSYRHMIASLVELILHVAAVLVAQVTEHLTERFLIPVVVDLGLQRLKVGIANVECSAIDMTTVWRYILIMLAKLNHIILTSKDTSNDKLLQRYMLNLQAVEEIPTNILKQSSGTGHKVGNACLQLTPLIIRVGANLHQLMLTFLGILDILYRNNTVLLCRNKV